MHTRWKIILLVIYEISVSSKIQCAWWDEGDGDLPRIFNSDGPAKIGRYPHVVAIVYIGQYYTNLLCEGVNIGTAFDSFGVVLTTGSCVNNIASGRIRKEDVFVVSNSEYWDCGCISNQQSGILSYRLHPKYKERFFPFIGEFNENDLGLLILKTPWKGVYNDMAVNSPIQFEPPKLVPGSITTLGWGFTSSENQTSDYLRVAKYMSVIPGHQCKKEFYKKCFPKNSYCIVTQDPPGKGPCPFARGGPVYYQNYRRTNLGLTNTLVGIISSAPGCGDPRKPTIVVNTTAHLKFIKSWYWVKDASKNIGKNLLQRSGEVAPIGKDWTCKKFSLGGKICCDSAKSQCIGVKPNGLWWWVENNEGIDNGHDKGLGGKNTVWEEKIDDSDENVDNINENVESEVSGYVGRGVDGDGWTKIINPQQTKINGFHGNAFLGNKHQRTFLLRNI